jgi:hypothetical protein
MKFFNLDCHISVIADIKNIFENLGHQVDTWSLSEHRWVFNLAECKSPIINYNNWKNLDEKMVDNFYEFHKEELDKYDAFICTHHIFFLKLFERFRKPIIVVASTRYEYPCFSDEKLIWLEDSLKNNNNLILIANNQFDQKYCEYFLKKEWQWIPSLCDYTKFKYNPSKKESIIFSKFAIKANKNFLHQSELGRYTWQDLYSYKKIIHFPYNVSTMSIFEQYQANVPLSFPSLDLSLNLIEQGFPLFSEIVFPNQNLNRQAKFFINKEWLSYSDFYNGTIISDLFESFEDQKIKLVNSSNKTIIYNAWESILKKIK